MALAAHERNQRIKIGIGSLIAYLIGYPILYAFDSSMFNAIEGDILTLFIHGHIVLLLAGGLWVFGYEWINSIVLILFLADVLFVARDRVTWGAALVAGLGMISCAYAAYRTWETVKARDEELSHDA